MFLFDYFFTAEANAISIPLSTSRAPIVNGEQVNLYLVENTESEIKEAARVLAAAFNRVDHADRPMDKHMEWIFGGSKNYEKYHAPIFQSWVRYALNDHYVLATDNFECVIMLKKPGQFGFSWWGMLRSGMIFSSIWYLGLSGVWRLSQYDEAAKKACLEIFGTDQIGWYLWQVGVDPKFARRGIGGETIRLALEFIRQQSNNQPITVYAEAISRFSAGVLASVGFFSRGLYDLPYSEAADAPVDCRVCTL